MFVLQPCASRARVLHPPTATTTEQTSTCSTVGPSQRGLMRRLLFLCRPGNDKLKGNQITLVNETNTGGTAAQRTNPAAPTFSPAVLDLAVGAVFEASMTCANDTAGGFAVGSDAKAIAFVSATPASLPPRLPASPPWPHPPGKTGVLWRLTPAATWRSCARAGLCARHGLCA